MVEPVKIRGRSNRCSPGRAADPAEVLDGATVVLRMTHEGFVVEATDPGRAGERMLGYFIPVSPEAGNGARRSLAREIPGGPGSGTAPVPAVISGYATGVQVRQPVPAHVPDPVPAEDCRDGEARRWKEIRENFLRDYRCLTAPELAVLTGSRSRNPSSRAHEWLRAGKIFAVYDGSSARFPLFQIDGKEGKPRPEIRNAVAHLREQLSDWQIAVWFTAANAWTGGWRRPVDLLGREPERLVDAARREVAAQVL